MSEAVEQQDNARSLHDEERRYYLPHQVIKGYCLEIAQLLFSENNPTGFTWRIEQAQSDITICDKYAFNLDHVGSTPCIVANRGPIAWARTSGFRQLQSMDMRTDRRVHTDLVQGGCILSCFSRQGEEAEDLAGYLFLAFQSLRDILRKLAIRGSMVPSYLGFFKVEATTMGEEALVKSDSRPQLSVVPVAIRATVQQRWSTMPKGKSKLQTVKVRTSTP